MRNKKEDVIAEDVFVKGKINIAESSNFDLVLKIDFRKIMSFFRAGRENKNCHKMLYKGNSRIHHVYSSFRSQPLKYFLITSIVLITAIKLCLIGEGFFYFSDEFRYKYSLMAMYEFSRLHFGEAFSYLFSAVARPGMVIIKIIPSAFQFITADIGGLHMYESDNSYPLFIFNFFIYCLILILHYKFSELLLKDRLAALFSVLLFGTLTNSYVYLRHVFPCDESLLIIYLVLYKTVKLTTEGTLTLSKSFILGFFSFFGFSVYPGYFPLFFCCLAILFFNNMTKKTFIKKFFQSIIYACGSILCLVLFEIMSRIGGSSYVISAFSITDKITMGSFEESFSFIFKYLYTVEGLTGVFLILGIAFFCFFMIFFIRIKQHKQHALIGLLGVVILGIFIVYAGAGYFFHKMVFYGRLLHQYVPFLCIFSVFAINELLIKTRWRNTIILILSLAFILNFCVNIWQYKKVTYPRDVAWKLSKIYNLQNVDNVSEYKDIYSVVVPELGNISFNSCTEPEHVSKTLIVTNCFIYRPFDDLTKYNKFQPGDDYEMIFSAPRSNNFKGYLFEGPDINQRKNAERINLQIKIFKKKLQTHYKSSMTNQNPQ